MKSNVRTSRDVLVVSIVQQVARKEGVEVDELPPLYDVIDGTLLEQLVETATGLVRIEFDYCGYRITVDGDGQVAITEDRVVEFDSRTQESQLL